MLEAILEYQQKDGQLVTIEREIIDSKAKKVVNQMFGLVKNAQQKLVVIEHNANILISEFNELSATFEKESKDVENFTKQKIEGVSPEDLVNYEKKVNEANVNLLLLEKNISRLSNSISDILKNFEKTKNEGIQAKQRYTQGMDAYNNLLESKQPIIKKLKKELAELEKKADAKLMSKYKKMRDDKKFPIFVPLLGHSCGGCSMELATSQINKLDENGMLECENCHRIIYKNK